MFNWDTRIDSVKTNIFQDKPPVKEPPDWPNKPPVKEPGEPPEHPPPPAEPPVERARKTTGQSAAVQRSGDDILSQPVLKSAGSYPR